MAPHPCSSTTLWGSLLRLYTWRAEWKKSFQRDKRGSSTLFIYFEKGTSGKRDRQTRGGEEHKAELKSNFFGEQNCWSSVKKFRKAKFVIMSNDKKWVWSLSQLFVVVCCLIDLKTYLAACRTETHWLPSGEFYTDDSSGTSGGGGVVCVCLFGLNVQHSSCTYRSCFKSMNAWWNPWLSVCVR